MNENKEYKSPIDYLIKSLEYAIKALQQYQIDKEREIEINKQASTLARKR